MRRIDRGIQAVLAAVFLGAGLLKIVEPLAFATSIARLRLLPAGGVGAVAIVLPWIEVVLAAALFVPKFREAALKLALVLLAVFTAVLGVALIRGTSTCGCFGSGDGFLNRAEVALARNTVLLALTVVLLRRKPTSPASPASPA